MKQKHLLILSIILAILAAGIFLKGRQKPAELVNEEFVSLDLSFETASVDQISLSRTLKGNIEKAELVKKEGLWVIPTLWNVRAEKEKVETFLNELAKAKGEERGRGKNLFPDFGINEDDGYHVILSSAGKTLLDVFLGDKKAGYDSVFIRKADSETVFLTQADLFGKMGVFGDPKDEAPKGDYWASMNFINFDTKTFQSLKISRFQDGKEITAADLAKTSEGWQFTLKDYPFAIDGGKVANYFSSLKTWQAQKALDPKAKDYGFSSPVWRLKSSRSEGDDFVINMVNGENGSYAMQVSTEPVVYAYSNYYFENMDLTDAHFFADNPLQADIDKTENFHVHSDKKDLTLKPIENKSENLKNYFEDLKKIQFPKRLFKPDEQGSFSGKYFLEIQKTGAPPVVLEVSDSKISMSTQEYAARIKGSPYVFALSDENFKSLFEGLDRFIETPAPAESSKKS